MTLTAAQEAMLTDFAEVGAFRRPGPRARLRAAARRWALESLAFAETASGSLHRALQRPRVHILYLHHVLRDEEQRFRALLAALQRDHAFIGYSEAVERIRRGAVDRPYVAFSFDDGLKSCLRAAEILEEVGARACFFVCTAMAEERDAAKIARFCREELHLPPAEFLTWQDMEALQKRGHEIGNHSARHKTLASLGAAELQADIGGAAEELRRRLGDVPHFAWPRGRFFHMSPEAVAAVFAAGHTTCASAERGAHVAAAAGAPEALCLRRDQIIAADPLRHALLFLARSARSASARSNLWPEAWRERIEQSLA